MQHLLPLLTSLPLWKTNTTRGLYNGCLTLEESISQKHSKKCLKTEELKSSKASPMLTNKMVEQSRSSGPSQRKQNQCISKPVSLNHGGNSRLNMLLMFTIRHLCVAIIGRPHINS